MVLIGLLVLIWLVELAHEEDSTCTKEQPVRENLNELGELGEQGRENVPVGLCWMTKRNGRSRVICSTAIRENITAADGGKSGHG